MLGIGKVGSSATAEAGRYRQTDRDLRWVWCLASMSDSGVMTFIVNQNGIVYQKALGTETASIARNITQFNPDATWEIP